MKDLIRWQPIETAPKDRPIIGLCSHAADPFWEDDKGKRITTYAAHAEGLGRVPDGPHVLVWGGSYHGSEDEGNCYIPDWWFRAGSEWEEVANPTHWAPLPADEVSPPGPEAAPDAEPTRLALASTQEDGTSPHNEAP